MSVQAQFGTQRARAAGKDGGMAFVGGINRLQRCTVWKARLLEKPGHGYGCRGRGQFGHGGPFLLPRISAVARLAGHRGDSVVCAYGIFIIGVSGASSFERGRAHLHLLQL